MVARVFLFRMVSFLLYLCKQMETVKKSKFTSKKSWRSKLEKPQEPEIVEVGPNSPRSWGDGTMVIVTPMLIDEVVRTIPKGKLTTITAIREKFARDFGTDVTCPLTTGIFLRICAETAEEDRAKGSKDVSPYWRVIRDTGELVDKFPGGTEHHAELLQQEGFEILITGRKGNKLVVKDYREYMFLPE